MKLLCVTDLHDRDAAFERILAHAGPVDVILMGGDITNFGSPDDAERLVRQARQNGAEVLAVAGNCDSAAIDRRLAELGVSLHGRGVVRGDVGLHGLSGIPPWRKGMYQFTEEELAAALHRGHAAVAAAPRRVLLAHAPPHGCKPDRTFLFQHVGSQAVRTFIDEAQPDLVFCGHIHEGRGRETLGPTLVVNCGAAAKGRYALAELGEGWNVELREA